MEKPYHRFSELFAQLGLASDASSIRAFIERHSPLDDATRLEDAPCWSQVQSKLLRELIAHILTTNQIDSVALRN